MSQYESPAKKPREIWLHLGYGDMTGAIDWDAEDMDQPLLKFNEDEFYTLYSFRPMTNGLHLVDASLYERAVSALKFYAYVGEWDSIQERYVNVDKGKRARACLKDLGES